MGPTEAAGGHGSGEQQQRDILVGCALLPKKVARYLTPRMLETAAAHGIALRTIDYTAPLEPQGPFDVILHKLRPDPVWEAQLRSYVARHPGVVVVDSIDKIQQLHNRATMLRPLQGEGILITQPPRQQQQAQAQHAPQQQQQQQRQQQQQQQAPVSVRVQAPLQVELLEGTTEAQAQAALAAAGLAPPLLCKPLWTDGRDGSHKLAVLHDLEALGQLLRGAVCVEFKPPLVVQQYVEHGGVLFKVYVLGEQTYTTARPSLGDTVLQPEAAVQQLPRISCVSVFGKQQQHEQQMRTSSGGRGDVAGGSGSGGAAGAGAREEGSAHGVDQPPLSPSPPPPQQQPEQQQQQQQQQQSPAMAAVVAESVWEPRGGGAAVLAPPAWLTCALAATLRHELGMQLFNFDVLVPEPDGAAQRAQLAAAAARGEEPVPPVVFVADINFFPGVDKLPDFEQRFVQFLLAAAASGSGSSRCGGCGSRGGAPAQLRSSSACHEQQQQQQQQQQVRSAEAGRGSSIGGSGSPAAPGAMQPKAPRSASSGSCSGGGGGGRRSSSHGHGRHGSGGRVVVDGPAAAAAVAAGQWAETQQGLLGSSPPLQVAGCG